MNAWLRKTGGIAMVSAIAFAVPQLSGAEAAERIVSVGGSVTEIVYRLGEGRRLVARDATSNFPQEALELTDIGYIRALSPEGVLSVSPDMILSLEGAGPPEAISLLKEAGVEFVEIPEGATGEAILAKIRAVGAALGVEEKAESLAREAAADLEETVELSKGLSERTRVLFILAVQGGRILAAGKETQADGMIALAGGVNALEEITGYKPVSDEAIIASAPDAILVMRRGPEFGTERDQLLSHAAIAATPAGEGGRIIAMEGMYLLGFGPRTARAARDLHRQLYLQSQDE